LWALTFGNGHEGGAADTLFFTAGVASEQHGLFGAIQSPQRKGADTAGPGAFDPDAPSEPDDYPLPPRGGPALQDRVDDARPATAVLLPLRESSLVQVPTLTTLPLPGELVVNPVSAAPIAAGPYGGTARTVSGTAPPPVSEGAEPSEDRLNHSLPLSVFL